MDSAACLSDDIQLETDEPEDRSTTIAARTRAKVRLTLAFWSINYTAFTLGNVLMAHPQVFEMAVMRAALDTLGLLFCFLIHLVLQRLAHRPFKTRALMLALMAPVAAETFAWVNYFGFNAVLVSHVVASFDWNTVIFTLSMWTWFFAAWAGLYLALEYSYDIKDEERRSSRLLALAHAAQLRALHNQVNPHFLFNSLNSISALILDRRLTDADDMITRLSGFFRSTIAIDPMVDIRLDEEIRLQRDYLAIEQARYPDLVVDVDLPAGLEDVAIPALLLQPLVENAVKYGVAQSMPPARITITVRQEDNHLVLVVRDRGVRRPGMRPATGGAGIGLQNVRKRLLERFGAEQSFDAHVHDASGFEVVIRMPIVHHG